MQQAAIDFLTEAIIYIYCEFNVYYPVNVSKLSLSD